MSKDQIQYGPNASLDGHDVDLASADRLIESLRQQLSGSQKREVMLRGYCEKIAFSRIGKCIDLAQELFNREKWATEALAATADLDGLILCYAGPVAEFIMDGFSLGKTKFLVHSGEPLHEGEMLYRAWEPKP